MDKNFFERLVNLDSFINILKEQPCLWVKEDGSAAGWTVYNDNNIMFFDEQTQVVIYKFNPNLVNELTGHVLASINLIKPTVH